MKKNSISKLFDLTDKVIVLTGSAGRLGENFAHILSESGANVVLIDIDKKKNQILAKYGMTHIVWEKYIATKMV